jgi:hypothetical protein
MAERPEDQLVTVDGDAARVVHDEGGTPKVAAMFGAS